MLIDAANLFSRKEPVSKEAFDSAIQDMSSEEKDSLLWALLQQRNSRPCAWISLVLQVKRLKPCSFIYSMKPKLSSRSRSRQCDG
uniref:Uncharacterized protein n=1 Tax=Faecalibaculum rodentium TaxID=1702221 RepID=A0A140DTM1_9FIRM|nr:hypothetical protein AALO17_08640 [Faecalibaculum rodentium]